MAEIVVDTSVFVAIFKREPAASSLRNRLNSASSVLVPAWCLVELALLRRLHPQLLDWAQDHSLKASYSLIELTLEEAQLAVKAAKNYGKGSGHPAQLNFGDCLVYAAAKYREVPLLFTGNDFSSTDIANALLQED